jgi:hypothetical protein
MAKAYVATLTWGVVILLRSYSGGCMLPYLHWLHVSSYGRLRWLQLQDQQAQHSSRSRSFSTTCGTSNGCDVAPVQYTMSNCQSSSCPDQPWLGWCPPLLPTKTGKRIQQRHQNVVLQ